MQQFGGGSGWVALLISYLSGNLVVLSDKSLLVSCYDNDVEYYNNDVSVHSVYTQTVFYGL